MPSIKLQPGHAARLGARARAPAVLGAALALLIALAVLALRAPAGPEHAPPAVPVGSTFPPADRTSPAVPSEPGSPGPAATPRARADPRTAITARLRQILRVREGAFAQRDMRLLETVYTADCPCLRSARAAIARLLTDGAVWRGRAMTVEV